MRNSRVGLRSAGICLFTLLLAGLACETGPAVLATPEGEISFERTTEILDEVDRFLNGLDEPNRDTKNDKIAQFLRGLPDITNAGVHGSGTVWAEFTDGRRIAICNNVDLVPPLDEKTVEVSTEARPVVKDTASKNIPMDRAALISCKPLGVGGIVDDLQQLFTEKGYEVSPKLPGAEEWLNMQPSGVYYFEGHAGTMRSRIASTGEEFDEYFITTSIPRNANNDLILAQDLRDYSAIHVRDPNVGYWQYGITAAFIRKHVNFAPESLVFLNMCEGDSPLAQPFKEACLAKGAGIYLAWNSTVLNYDCFGAAYFIFDIMLGANLEVTYTMNGRRESYLPPVSQPLRRAFELSTVFQAAGPTKPDIYVFQKSKSVGRGYLFGVDRNGNEVFLSATLNGNLPAERFKMILVPSIWFLEVDETKDELIIYGGAAGGFEIDGTNTIVSVGGVEYHDNVEWSDSRIVVKGFPKSGPGSYGEVRVIQTDAAGSNRRMSNPRWLTAFKGVGMNHTTRFCNDDLDDSCDRFIKGKFRDLTLRVDIGNSRTSPFRDPEFASRRFPGYPVQNGGSFSFEIGGEDKLTLNRTERFESNHTPTAELDAANLIDGLRENTFTAHFSVNRESPLAAPRMDLTFYANVPDAYDIVCEITAGDYAGESCGGGQNFAVGCSSCSFENASTPATADTFTLTLNPDNGWPELSDTVDTGDRIIEYSIFSPEAIMGWPNENEAQ